MAKSPQTPIVVAIPKGRVLKQLAVSFRDAGIDPAILLAEDRTLVRTDPKTGVSFLLLKPDDVPTYVEYGAADIGIVGRDILLEREYDLYVPIDLGIGRCRLAVCGLPGTDLSRPGLRIATKFPNVATRHFHAKGQPVESIFVQGSVEIAPLMGLADVIVDLVESGETLRQNGLVVLEEIHQISSVVIANRVSFKLKHDALQPLLKTLERLAK